MEQEIYKVLWVEDNDKIVRGTRLIADESFLVLDWFPNWQKAREKLMSNFEDYSAIIFDAYCVSSEGENPDKDFIPITLIDLNVIFAIKGNRIPWYILSAGTMENFSGTIKIAEACRADVSDDWGEMYFHKEDDSSSTRALFTKIREIAEKKFQNSVLYKHKEVFAYLGEGKDKVIDSREAKSYMLKMLEALYYPEKNQKFQYEGNPIRKVLEYMFWAAKKRGLLPEECFNERGVALQNARKFMEGKTIPIAEDGEIVYKVRWGKNREKIFDDDVAKGVQIILDFANSDSHVDDEYVDEETPYFVNEDKKEMFFSYVMQLCYVIRWFGKYVGKHPDAGKNREKHSFLDYTPLTREDVIGKKALVRNEGEYYRAWRCKLSEECNPSKIVGKECVIEEVVENTEADNKLHPFIATKITLVTEG